MVIPAGAGNRPATRPVPDVPGHVLAGVGVGKHPAISAEVGEPRPLVVEHRPPARRHPRLQGYPPKVEGDLVVAEAVASHHPAVRVQTHAGGVGVLRQKDHPLRLTWCGPSPGLSRVTRTRFGTPNIPGGPWKGAVAEAVPAALVVCEETVETLPLDRRAVRSLIPRQRDQHRPGPGRDTTSPTADGAAGPCRRSEAGPPAGDGNNTAGQQPESRCRGPGPKRDGPEPEACERTGRRVGNNALPALAVETVT